MKARDKTIAMLFKLGMWATAFGAGAALIVIGAYTYSESAMVAGFLCNGYHAWLLVTYLEREMVACADYKSAYGALECEYREATGRRAPDWVKPDAELVDRMDER